MDKDKQTSICNRKQSDDAKNNYNNNMQHEKQEITKNTNFNISNMSIKTSKDTKESKSNLISENSNSGSNPKSQKKIINTESSDANAAVKILHGTIKYLEQNSKVLSIDKLSSLDIQSNLNYTSEIHKELNMKDREVDQYQLTMINMKSLMDVSIIEQEQSKLKLIKIFIRERQFK